MEPGVRVKYYQILLFDTFSLETMVSSKTTQY